MSLLPNTNERATSFLEEAQEIAFTRIREVDFAVQEFVGDGNALPFPGVKMEVSQEVPTERPNLRVVQGDKKPENYDQLLTEMADDTAHTPDNPKLEVFEGGKSLTKIEEARRLAALAHGEQVDEIEEPQSAAA